MSTLASVDAPTDTGLRPLLTVSQLAQTLGLSRNWIYRRTGPKAVDPIPVVRLGKRGVRFNPDHVLLYIRSRERHPISDKMGAIRRNCPSQRKGLQIDSQAISNRHCPAP